MPGRHGVGALSATVEKRGGSGGVSLGQQWDSNDPCLRQRNPVDVAGRINDLINCYISRLIPVIKEVAPLYVLALILIAILIIAAYKIIKD
jgi:hypothetical protein